MKMGWERFISKKHLVPLRDPEASTASEVLTGPERPTKIFSLYLQLEG